MPTVIVPPNPGIFSAVGMILADVVKDYSITVMLRERETGYEQLRELFSPLVERALEEMGSEGFKEEEITLELSLDMRYEGQSYEISVPFSEDYVEDFHRAHERHYGYRHRREVEIVNLRVRAVGTTEKPELPTFEEKSSEDPSEALLGSVRTAFGGEFLETKVYQRERLRWGNRVEGPAIVVEYSSTTLIPPGAVARVDRLGNLIISV